VNLAFHGCDYIPNMVGCLLLSSFHREQPVATGREQVSADQRSADQRITECEARIAGNPETADRLDELTSEQRRQLAALEMEIETQLAENLTSRWVHKESATLLRALDRERQKLQRDLEAHLVHAQDSYGKKALDPYRHRARQIIGEPYRTVAEQALNILKNAPERVVTERPPIDNAMVRLFRFFSECGWSGHMSEVQVARLRNTFWTQYGIKPVPYRPKCIGGQSPGCDAVQSAVRRSKAKQR